MTLFDACAEATIAFQQAGDTLERVKASLLLEYHEKYPHDPVDILKARVIRDTRYEAAYAVVQTLAAEYHRAKAAVQNTAVGGMFLSYV